MRTLVSLLHTVMAGLFIFAAVLQYNDEDMVRWAAIYLAAAACCVGGIVGKLKWWIPALLAAVSVGWALIYVSRGAAGMPVGEMFAEWEMKNEQIVEEREMFGLGIVAVWMIILAVQARRKPAAQS